MTYTLHGIPNNKVDDVWSVCAKQLRPALERTDDYELEDIHTHIQERDMQLWVIKNNKEIVASFITEIIVFPNQRILSLPYLGGRDCKRWLHLLPIVEDFGKSKQCEKLRFYIRDGWKKRLNIKEFNQEYTCIAKEL